MRISRKKRRCFLQRRFSTEQFPHQSRKNLDRALRSETAGIDHDISTAGDQPGRKKLMGFFL